MSVKEGAGDTEIPTVEDEHLGNTTNQLFTTTLQGSNGNFTLQLYRLLEYTVKQSIEFSYPVRRILFVHNISNVDDR